MNDQTAKISVDEFMASYGGGTKVPADYDDIINRASETHSVDPELIKAMISVESSGKPGAVSGKGAGGLMQLMPATAKELGVTDRFDPEQNIAGGTKYLRQMLDRYDGNETLALAAYNAGAGNVTKYGGVPPFKETQNYIKKIADRRKKRQKKISVDEFMAGYKPGVPAGEPIEEPIEEPAGPAFVQGQPPTMLERGREAVTDFFRRDPGLGPLTEEDYAAFEPADVSIPGEPAAEPIISDIPISGIEGQIPSAEPIDTAALAIAGLTPEEAALGRPVSTITGKPVPTPEEEAAGGMAAMAVIPYGFASAVRGLVPPALERAVMDPLTQAIVGKEYVSPIDEALKIGKYLPEEGQMAIGVPAHMAGAIVPLSVSFKTAGAIMKAVGLPPDLVLRTGPVMDRITAHVARGGIAGAVYGGLEAGTPKGMAEDAAFFGALEGGLGVAGGIFRKIFSANWYRNLEVKERGLVVQSLDDMLARGYSEGEILKQWNNPMWREEALARRVVGEPPPEPAAPGLSETQRDLAKEVIREETAKSSAWETVTGGEGVDVMSRVPAIPGRQIPPVPPGMPPPAAPAGPAPGVLPPGRQDFEFIEPMPEVRLRLGPRPRRGPEYPEGAEYVAGMPAPEELIVEHKPILGSHGLPWKEEERALKAFKSKRLKDMGVTEETYEVVPFKKGFGVARKAEEIAEPRIEAPATKGAWYINVEDKPIWLKAGDETIGFRGPYSEIDVSELTGIDKFYLKKDGKPIEFPEIEVKKPVIEISEKPAEPAMSPELKELHDHKARTLGFEKVGGSFVEGYLKKLASVAEKTDISAATAAYSALSEYKKGNINQAALEAEKILGKLHKAEKEALMPKPKVEPKIEPKVEPKIKIERPEKITAETIRAELPEAVRKLPVGRITGRDLDGAAKALGIRRDTAFTVLKEAEPKEPVKPEPEVKKVEPEKPFEPDLAAMPLEKITVKTKALRETTGETVTTKENAKEALARIDDEIAKYKKLLECL